MASADSPEVITMKQCVSQMETALKGCDSNLVHFLEKEGFISEDVHDEILNPSSMLSMADKAGALVKWIRNRIKLHPESFHKLVQYFKQCGNLHKPIATILEEEYHNASSLLDESLHVQAIRSATTSSETLPTTSSSKYGRADNVSDFSGLQKINPRIGNLILYGDTTRMTADEIAMMEIEFERETKEIKGEFSRLLLRLEKSLEKSCKMDHLVNLLINLDDEDWLKRCSSIADVFQRASKFCSFYDNKAVKLLIEELGTEQDKKNYEEYKRKFQRFCLKRVFLFPSGKSSVEVGMLAMKTDKYIEKLPPKQKKELQYEIGRVFKAGHL